MNYLVGLLVVLAIVAVYLIRRKKQRTAEIEIKQAWAKEVIELLETDPKAAFAKMGYKPLSPEIEAGLKAELAGLSYEEIRLRVGESIAKAKRSKERQDS